MSKKQPARSIEPPQIAANRACGETLTASQIEAAFDLLGLKTDQDREVFLKYWSDPTYEAPSGKFAVKLGNSSTILP